MIHVFLLQLISRFNKAYQRIVIFHHCYGYPLLTLVRRDFKIRYAPTFLGLGWAVLQPLIFLLVYTFAFKVILKVRFNPEDSTSAFVLYLVCGFLPFMALSEGIQRGSTSLTENRSLLKKVIFPAEVLPAVSVVSTAVTEAIGLFLLLVVASFFGVRPSVWLAFLPLLIMLRIVITLGLAWLVGVLNVFMSDLGQFLGLLLTAWMFLTPIFYPADAMPHSLLWLMKVNPLYHLVAAYRAVILQSCNPVHELPVLILWAVGIAIFGLWFFRKTVERAKDFL